MAFFDITLRTSGSLHADGEPTDYLSEYTGFICHTRDRDERTFRVGKIHAWHIHAGLAHDSGASVFDACDAESQELLDLYTALFDRQNDDLRLAVRNQLGSLDADVLVLDYVVLISGGGA
jgi:hypothetical protein